MKAVVYRAPREFTVEEVAVPVPSTGEIRLRVLRTGICGTDLHLHEGEFDAAYPLTPGHEIVGLVDTIGPGVETDLKPGQMVVVDNRIGCQQCRQCRLGRTNLCRAATRLGVTAPGGFAEYMNAPAYKCVDASMLSLDQAALAEPLACAIHALDVLGMEAGARVLVMGSGPAGLIISQLLRSAGAGGVTVAAPTRFKLDIAAELGADHTVLLDRAAPEAANRQFRDIAGDGFDVVVDTTGQPAVLDNAMTLLADGGTLLAYGMADPGKRISLDPFEVFRRELTLKGTFSQAFAFDRSVAALAQGKVRPDGIISHRFGIDQFADALTASRSDRSCVKAVIDL